MKYTAIAVEVMGVMIAGYAAVLYLGDTETAAGTGGTSLATVGLLLGFALALMAAGAAMLAYGGKGFSESHGTFWRRRRDSAAAAKSAAAGEQSK